MADPLSREGVSSIAPYTNLVTASSMAVPGVRKAVRRFGRNSDDGFVPYNPGNVAAAPFATQYGGTINAAISANPNITKQELEQLVIQQEQADARKKQEDAIAAYFADPVRQAMYAQQYDAELAASKEALGQQTQQGMRSIAQQQAMRGTLGGSTDIERRTGLAGNYQSTLADLAQRRGLAGLAQQSQDAQDKTSLVELVNAADPFSGEATRSRLSALSNQGQAARGYISAGLTRDQADQAGAVGMSQALGQGLSGFANGLKTYQNRRYQAGYQNTFGG